MAKQSLFKRKNRPYRLKPYGAENRMPFNRCPCCDGWWVCRLIGELGVRTRASDRVAARMFKRRARLAGKREVWEQLFDV